MVTPVQMNCTFTLNDDNIQLTLIISNTDNLNYCLMSNKMIKDNIDLVTDNPLYTSTRYNDKIL